jgi:hemoglobin
LKADQVTNGSGFPWDSARFRNVGTFPATLAHLLPESFNMSTSTGSPAADPEAAIMACVRGFYGEAQKDPILGPIFAAKVHDWEVHYQVVSNFWSHFLFGTDRYGGHPYPVHQSLPVEPEHFDRWLALFAVATKEHLPPDLAERALAKAHQMAQSFKAGIFPFTDAQGRPSRQPA